MKRFAMLAVVLSLIGYGLAGQAEAQAAGDGKHVSKDGRTVTLTEGESVDFPASCHDESGSKVMTVADAGSVTVSQPKGKNIADATVVDPNGNDGKGTPIKEGQVESPTIRIDGNTAGETEMTVLVSCPTLYLPTSGIGLAKHKWVKVKLKIVVKPRPPVVTGDKGDKDKGDKGGNNGDKGDKGNKGGGGKNGGGSNNNGGNGGGVNGGSGNGTGGSNGGNGR